jgi:Arc/MetJ family transcription regulator
MVRFADSTVDPCFNLRENIECREGGMKSSDPYAVTDSLDDALLQVIVTRLETRGRHPAFEKMLMDYLKRPVDRHRHDRARHGLRHRCRPRDRPPPRFFGPGAWHRSEQGCEQA